MGQRFKEKDWDLSSQNSELKRGKIGEKLPTEHRCQQSKLPKTKAKCIENLKLNEKTGPVKGTTRKKKNNVLWHMAFQNSH